MTNAFMECPEETLARLKSDREKGLTARQAGESRKANGENSFSKSEQKSLFHRIWEAATEPMLIMLVIAADYHAGGQRGAVCDRRGGGFSGMYRNLCGDFPVRCDHRGDGGEEREGF